MKQVLLCLLFWSSQLIAADDQWQHQSYKQSKRLPDLHHAVDVKLLETMQPAKTFELEDNKIVCASCHGLKDMAEIPYDKVDKKAPDFLRGGPYKNIQSFCFNCHDKKASERENIHILLDENQAINKKNCLFCHQEIHEKRDHKLGQAQLKLRLPPEKLCLGCHLKSPHLNAIEHQDAKPKPEMKKYMDKQAQDQNIILPLAENGHVTCISCHSPHQKGVLEPSNIAGNQIDGDIKQGITYKAHSWDQVFRNDKQDRLMLWELTHNEGIDIGYERIEQEVLLRLPAKDGRLCLSCHQFER